MLESITGGYKTKAKVVGDTLILSFPDALQPSVWRLDLKDAQGCIFEIEGDEAGGVYSLVQKSAKGSAKKVITSYFSRPQAMRALIVTSKALSCSNACGAMKEQSAKDTPIVIQNRSGFPWGKILFLLLILYLGYSAYRVFMVSFNNALVSESAPAVIELDQIQKNNKATAPNVNQSGVPLSAEDFLNNLENNK